MVAADSGGKPLGPRILPVKEKVTAPHCHCFTLIYNRGEAPGASLVKLGYAYVVFKPMNDCFVCPLEHAGRLEKKIVLMKNEVNFKGFGLHTCSSMCHLSSY